MSLLSKKPFVFRMPSYDAERHCTAVVELGSIGKNLAQIAKHLGVPRSLLFAWARENSEFAYALELSQEYSLAFWSDKAESGLFDPSFRSDVFSKMMGIMFPKDIAGQGGLPDLGGVDVSGVDATEEVTRLLGRRGLLPALEADLKKMN